MHVLLVTPWYKPKIGGVVTSVSTLAHTLVSQGNRCSVLVLDDIAPVPTLVETEEPNLNVWALRLRPLYYHPKSIIVFIAWLVYFFPTLLMLRRFVKQEQIDMIEIHYPGSWSTYFIALRWLFRIPYVVYVHGSDVMANPRIHVLEYLGVGLTIRSSSALVACSRRMLDDTRSVFRFLPKLSQARYLGIGADWATKGASVSPAMYGLTDGKYIICNAFPVHVKGIDILLQAFSKVAPRYPDVDLVLIGDRPDEMPLQDLIAHFGLERRVKLPGGIPNEHVPAIFKGALFGVIPSRREGLPRVALEFQLVGKAVIASNVGGLPETIVDGFNGFLVPPQNADALAERLDFCLRYPEILQQLGRNGRTQVMQHYTDSIGGREAVNLYESLVATR